jgi:PhzF family phenazine biosynthesis protein
MKYHIYQIDSFTKEKFSGNPAGVVTNADGLDELQMQKIARELNNSETAFIFSAQNSDHDVCIRFFTPTCEVPICGHATIAAHYARAVELNLKNCKIIQKTGAGNLPVEIIKQGDDYEIVMNQGKYIVQKIDLSSQNEILQALKISQNELDEKCPIEIASTGHSKVMIAIKSKKILNALSPDLEKLKDISKKIGCNGYYVFTLNYDNSEILTHGRMFAPAIGINEDPVTGNASGPLGAYLINHSLVKHNGKEFSFLAEQGEAIAKKGLVEVIIGIKNNKPETVRIKGNAVVVFKSEIEI